MIITLFDPENWREIIATLMRNKTRTFLTAFGIFWGTAMLALLWGGANGFQGIMMRKAAGISTNMAAISTGTRNIPYKGMPRGSSWTLTEQDIEAIRRKIPEIEASSSMNFNQRTIVHNDKSKAATILGVEHEYFVVNTLNMIEGRKLNSSDISAKRKCAIIGKNLVAELFPNESPIGKLVQIDGISITIVGIASQRGEASIGARVDDALIIPASTFHATLTHDNQVNFFVFTVHEGQDPGSVIPTIRRILSLNHTIHPNDENAIFAMNVSETFKMIGMMFLGISILALFVGGGSLMAGIIGVGNIMWIIVKERTNEFGIRRAIGARPQDITMQVLSESILLTLVSGVLGIVFATLILGALDHATADPTMPLAGFSLSWVKAMSIVVAFLVLGSLAGTLPAIKAMKIKPIEAIQAK